MASLLIEIQTEELPPKALDNLSKAFAKELTFRLKEQDLALPNAQVTAYGSPRRIAALISDVSEVAPDKPFRQKLVPVKSVWMLKAKLSGSEQEDEGPRHRVRTF